MRRLFLIILGSIFIAQAASAEDSNDSWTSDQGKESFAPGNENRIIRWCDAEGNFVRFASANIEIRGHQPCGELNVPVSCDAGGQRFIGAGMPGHYAHRGCDVKPRIMIERTDNPASELPDMSDVAIENSGHSDGTPAPMHAEEKRELAQELKQIEAAQSQDVEMQVQRMLDGVLGQLLSQTAAMQPSGKTKRGKQFKDAEIDSLIRHVDKKHQQQLRDVLRGF